MTLCRILESFQSFTGVKEDVGVTERRARQTPDSQNDYHNYMFNCSNVMLYYPLNTAVNGIHLANPKRSLRIVDKIIWFFLLETVPKPCCLVFPYNSSHVLAGVDLHCPHGQIGVFPLSPVSQGDAAVAALAPQSAWPFSADQYPIIGHRSGLGLSEHLSVLHSGASKTSWGEHSWLGSKTRTRAWGTFSMSLSLHSSSHSHSIFAAPHPPGRFGLVPLFALMFMVKGNQGWGCEEAERKQWLIKHYPSETGTALTRSSDISRVMFFVPWLLLWCHSNFISSCPPLPHCDFTKPTTWLNLINIFSYK